MPLLSKKQLLWSGLAAICLFLLIVFSKASSPDVDPIEVSVLGKTNDASGSPMVLVNVRNHTEQLRLFYLVAIVPMTNNIWISTGSVIRPPELPDRLDAHAECNAWIPVPRGIAKWKLSCTSRLPMSKSEQFWYLGVRQTGLNRIGFRDQPSESHATSGEISP